MALALRRVAVACSQRRACPPGSRLAVLAAGLPRNASVSSSPTQEVLPLSAFSQLCERDRDIVSACALLKQHCGPSASGPSSSSATQSLERPAEAFALVLRACTELEDLQRARDVVDLACKALLSDAVPTHLRHQSGRALLNALAVRRTLPGTTEWVSPAASPHYIYECAHVRCIPILCAAPLFSLLSIHPA